MDCGAQAVTLKDSILARTAKPSAGSTIVCAPPRGRSPLLTHRSRRWSGGKYVAKRMRHKVIEGDPSKGVADQELPAKRQHTGVGQVGPEVHLVRCSRLYLTIPGARQDRHCGLARTGSLRAWLPWASQGCKEGGPALQMSPESSLTRSSFNSIVSRQQANVSEMMIRHSNMGRQAEMGPDWKPSALITIAKAQGGAASKKPGIPGLTAPRSSPAPSPIVKSVMPASQMSGMNNVIEYAEAEPPSEMQALRANLAAQSPAEGQAGASGRLYPFFRSSSTPSMRSQNALSWASKERRTPTTSKQAPLTPQMQRMPTPLQASAMAQLDDG
ncbi:unnamed protein product, partial [Prorocentrum cordatum]